MKRTNGSYAILIGTKNFTKRYYRDKIGWLKVSARQKVSDDGGAGSESPPACVRWHQTQSNRQSRTSRLSSSKRKKPN